MRYVSIYIGTSTVYWSLGDLWVPGSRGMDQHTLVNYMVEKFCFGCEGIILEEGGLHLAMMGCWMVFGVIVY